MKVERKPIPGFPGYAIDVDGNIWSRKKNKGIGRGSVPSFSNKWHTIKTSYQKTGYYKVHLRKNRKTYHFQYHRLLAQIFISNPNNLPEVAHNDGNPSHNCIPQKNCGCGGNLRWATHAGNHADRKSHGTSNAGQFHPLAKLENDDIPLIIELYQHSKLNLTGIGRIFKVSRKTVDNILRRKTWKHLSFNPLSNECKNCEAIRQLPLGIYTGSK